MVGATCSTPGGIEAAITVYEYTDGDDTSAVCSTPGGIEAAITVVPAHLNEVIH